MYHRHDPHNLGLYYYPSLVGTQQTQDLTLDFQRLKAQIDVLTEQLDLLKKQQDLTSDK